MTKPSRPFIAHSLVPIILIVILLAAAPLTGCGAEETATPTPTKTPTPIPLATSTPLPTATPQPTSTPTKVPTPTNTPTPTLTPTSTPTVPALVEMGPDVNPLTGLKTDPQKLERRPLAVKIPNYPPAARPQSGLSLADVVIEHEAEARLTRFMAIFLANDVSPELGPIRSIRLVDAEVVPIFKAVLVASGGHPTVKLRVTDGKAWAAGYKRVICPEAPFSGSGAMRRIPKEGRIYELTMYSDTETLWKVCTERGVNDRQDFGNMWTFGELPPEGGLDATTLRVIYREGHVEAEYRYDAEAQAYKRFDVGEPLIDALNGEQIAPANVLVLYVNHVDSDIAADTHDPNNIWYSVSIQLWGEGKAKLLRNGQVYEGKWVRQNPQQADDRLLILDAEGKQIPFKPGTTWIQLVRLDADVQID